MCQWQCKCSKLPHVLATIVTKLTKPGFNDQETSFDILDVAKPAVTLKYWIFFWLFFSLLWIFELPKDWEHFFIWLWLFFQSCVVVEISVIYWSFAVFFWWDIISWETLFDFSWLFAWLITLLMMIDCAWSLSLMVRHHYSHLKLFLIICWLWLIFWWLSSIFPV